MSWIQKEITLPSFPQGIHPITDRILSAVPEISQIKMGLMNLFIRHTSASLTINENADPDVLVDLNRLLDDLVPEEREYRHQEEGRDDMPAHGKASLTDFSLTIPIRDGRLALGVWQGICLCEHRRQGGRRKILLTLQGEIL